MIGQFICFVLIESGRTAYVKSVFYDHISQLAKWEIIPAYTFPHLEHKYSLTEKNNPGVQIVYKRNGANSMLL